jgi:putative acyl-CoA dehydrogenase
LRAAADRVLRGLQADPESQQAQARQIAQDLVLLVQADLLLRHAPEQVSRVFVDSRLAGSGGRVYGAQAAGLASDVLLQRAWPA